MTGLGDRKSRRAVGYIGSVPVSIGMQTASEQSLTWDIMDRFHTSGRSLESMIVKVTPDWENLCWLGKHMCGKYACTCGKVVHGPGLCWHPSPNLWLHRVPEMPSDGPQGVRPR